MTGRLLVRLSGAILNAMKRAEMEARTFGADIAYNALE